MSERSDEIWLSGAILDPPEKIFAKAEWDRPPDATYGLENIVDPHELNKLSQWQRERLFYMDAEKLRTDPPPGVTPLPAYQHFHNMLLCDFPPGERWHDWVSNYWTLEMCYWYCEEEHDWLFVNGAGSTGKSKALAYIIYEDLKAAPSDTFIYVTSDTQDGLKERAWKYISEAWEADKTPVGRKLMRDNKPSLLVESEHKGDAGLRCITFEKGDAPDKVKKAIGAHNTRMRYFLEEGNACPPAAWLAISNIIKGCKDFKGVSAQNPTDYEGECGRRQRPTHPGITHNDITPFILSVTDHRACIAYESDDGNAITMHTDPRRSPAMTYPGGQEAGIEKFFWYEDSDTIEKMQKDLNTPGKEYEVYTQGLGLVPPGGTTSTVLTRESAARGMAQLRMPDTFQPVGTILSIDWAFNGGNKAVATVMDWGILEGIAGEMINFREMFEHESGDGELILTQLTNWGVDLIRRFTNANTHYVAADCTGNGGLMVSQRIEEILGAGLYYVISSQSKGLTERGRVKKDRKHTLSQHDFMTVSNTHDRLAAEFYKDRPTEILKTGAMFISSGQTRNMPDEVISQLARRPMHPGSPLKAFSKKEADPGGRGEFDHSDAFCVGTQMLRERFGVHPGGMTAIETNQNNLARQIQELQMKDRARMFERAFEVAPDSESIGNMVHGREVSYGD